MNSIYLLAPAKINLYLEIVGDRPDGYHELVMLMQSIGLSDILECRLNGTEDCRLFCQNPLVPTDQSNLIYKAIKLVDENFPDAQRRFGGIDITLTKKIPIAAGVAGGSGNAAATLVALNQLWELGLDDPQLLELAAKLGSDVPFSLIGGTALATGRGEKIEPLPALKGFWLVLAKYESLGVSTIWAYQTYRQQFSANYRTDAQSRGEQTRARFLATMDDPSSIGQLLHNDLEKVVLPTHPQVEQLRQTLERCGGLGTMMSGSGPSVFTLCSSEEEAKAIANQTSRKLESPDLKIWVTPLLDHGVSVDN